MVEHQIMNYIDTPDRSLVQRMEALSKGNDIRTKRARFKEQMKATSNGASVRFAIDVILDPPYFMESMKAEALLLATRGFGKTKAQKYLRVCEISASKRLGGMTPRQRSSLVRALRFGL